ncbi:MAG: hypothetical protein LC793_18540 [Thermomicrobia bacterium]|nr:hypothetical protein [Thermomicrobia bacterium]
MSNATPGPWEIVEEDFGPDDEGGYLPTDIVGPNNACVLRTTDGWGVFFGEDQPDGAVAWANARLIAASPDMHALIALGQRMRTAQRDYFKSRSQGNLLAAKSLEAEWDRLAESVLAKADGALKQEGLL